MFGFPFTGRALNLNRSALRCIVTGITLTPTAGTEPWMTSIPYAAPDNRKGKQKMQARRASLPKLISSTCKRQRPPDFLAMYVCTRRGWKACTAKPTVSQGTTGTSLQHLHKACFNSRGVSALLGGTGQEGKKKMHLELTANRKAIIYKQLSVKLTPCADACGVLCTLRAGHQ